MDSVTTIAAAADIDSIKQVLTWGGWLIAGTLMMCIVWFAIRILHQFDTVVTAVSELKGLIIEDIHQLELRIRTLEVWREAMIENAKNERLRQELKAGHD